MAILPVTFSPRNILLIKPSAIGDVVHALPVLNLMRRRWPEARISWLVTPACAGLLQGHKQIDEVILFERRRFGQAWRNPATLLALWRFSRELRRHRFDLVVDLQGLFRSGWLAWKTRAPVRIGSSNARELGSLFYTHRVPVPWEWHAVDRNLAVAEALGCGKEPVEFHFAVTDVDRAAVAALVPPGRPYAVMLPGTIWPTKRWPVQHFAACVHPLCERFGLESVVAGGAEDSALAAGITGATDLCGKTTLPQLVALLERADFVIANDTGPMHIAAALGRPLLTPFGPTNPKRTGPFGRLDTVLRTDTPCSPCYSRRCSHRSCLKWISPQRMMESAGVQLNVKAGPS
jgi:lipopolysaccharide heptosyltransferase I